MTKPIYLNTAIPYLNGQLHIGHSLDYILADVYARYQRQIGNEVRFSVGVDEHGSKIAGKAKEVGKDPQDYVDGLYKDFQSVIKAMDISCTDYIRTTDAHHRGAVQYIWKQLEPYIYKKSYVGWYCLGCEAFVTDQEAAANNSVCPDHKQPYQRLSEDNYFFKANAFSDKVIEALKTNQIDIIPKWRRDEFLKLVSNGLQDISISRPLKSLSWGINVPGDPSQVMYVWFDALANYLTLLGYPDNQDWQKYWPSDLILLGKDIMRFHLGLWPPMLLALGLELPKKMLIHGYITVGGQKIGKSLGNGISPVQLINDYGLDAFRYYFIRHIPTFDDGDFTLEKFEDAYNNELANDLGNLVQRLATMVNKYQAGVIGEIIDKAHDDQNYHQAMAELNFNKAIEETWQMIQSLNKYIEDTKPWQIAKGLDKDTDAKPHLAEVLGYACTSILQIADLLAPFMPSTADTIKQIFGSGVVKLPKGSVFPKIYKVTNSPNQPKDVN